MSFLKYTGSARWWIFKIMGLGMKGMHNVKGLRFYKLMGSGAENGFSIKPDLSTYFLLCVWESETVADQFFKGHSFFKQLLQNTARWWTVYARHLKAHGSWGASKPFSDFYPIENGSLHAVLTRATIKTVKAVQFWKSVPGVSGDLLGRPGLIYSKGIGESPVFMQATISFWESEKAMIDYAYKSKEHAAIIKKTRSLGWYKEELFANFQPYRVEANFQHPLSHKLI